MIREDFDTLKQILLSKNYTDDRIVPLSGIMMSYFAFTASTTTMKNITASGEFDLIKDIELRKRIMNTYNSYEMTLKRETILSDFIDEYVIAFFYKNIHFRDFSSINSNFIKEPLFKNIVFGYIVLLDQQIRSYRDNLVKIKLLNEKLNTNTNRTMICSK